MTALRRVYLSIFDTYRGLPRSIYVLFFARIINSMGAFVYPFLTLFMTSKMGIGEQTAGLYIMIAAIASVPGSFLGGFLSDRLGRKKILIVFQGLAAASFIPCGFLGTSMIIPWLLIAANFFNGAAQPANSAMMADLTNSENRKQAYSLLYLGINVGYAVGPLIAGFLFENYIQWIFFGDALTTLVALILVMVLVPETRPSKEKIEESHHIDSNEKSETGHILIVLLKRPALLAFALVATIYSFVYAQHGFSIPLQLKDLFGEVTASKMFGTIMTTNAITVVFLTAFITKLTLKLRPIQNIAISGLLCAVGFGMLYIVDSYPWFIVSTVIWTLGEILNVTNSGVYIANHTPISHRGRFNSILPIITGSGFAIGPYVMGGYIENAGVRMVWPITLALSMLGATLMYGLYLMEKKKEIDGVS